MRYISTRGGGSPVTASEAVLRGIAEDGGLYVPERIPVLGVPLDCVPELSYMELAYEVLRLYFDDFTEDELKSCIAAAYGAGFDLADPAPVREGAGMLFLELFHGRTLAFKDMALSIHPHLMGVSRQKCGVDKKIVILTATSGDTGAAALAGFAGAEDTYIVVFYPDGGVSEAQKLQMTTRPEPNARVIAVKGNFDDAQNGVKSIFNDVAFNDMLAERGFVLSSANSINIGRLLPQIVYYIYAWGQLVKSRRITPGEAVNFTVPTGNFGNILAGYYAKRMGLPVNHLICASNINNVLYDFFTKGVYDRNRPFILTSSPSMDILVSSNLERLLYDLGGDTGALMKRLNDDGVYGFDAGNSGIIAAYADADEVAAAIRESAAAGHFIDPHTAVACAAYDKCRAESGDDRTNVILSTASPYKFGASVLSAIDGGDYSDWSSSELFSRLSELSGTAVPDALAGLDKRTVVHDNVCETADMRREIWDFLNLR